MTWSSLSRSSRTRLRASCGLVCARSPRPRASAAHNARTWGSATPCASAAPTLCRDRLGKCTVSASASSSATSPFSHPQAKNLWPLRGTPGALSVCVMGQLPRRRSSVFSPLWKSAKAQKPAQHAVSRLHSCATAHPQGYPLTCACPRNRGHGQMPLRASRSLNAAYRLPRPGVATCSSLRPAVRPNRSRALAAQRHTPIPGLPRPARAGSYPRAFPS